MPATEVTPFPVSFPLPCPMCREAEATATDAGFSATTCEVVPCDACRDSSGVRSLTMGKAATFQAAAAWADAAATSWQHPDGLVVFG